MDTMDGKNETGGIFFGLKISGEFHPDEPLSRFYRLEFLPSTLCPIWGENQFQSVCLCICVFIFFYISISIEPTNHTWYQYTTT